MPSPTTAEVTTAAARQEMIKAMEDHLVEVIEAMDDLSRATIYFYLHALGMTLEKARDIRRKAGVTR